MPFNINEIRNQLTFGGARASLFECRMTNPVNSAGDQKLSFMAQSSQLPASSLGTITVPYFGRQVKFAGNRTFEPWTLTILNDEDFLVRNALENWMAAINTHIGNINQQATPNGYKSQGQIIQYSKSGGLIREYTFNGMFPTSVAAIDASWESEDIQTFEVTFEYDWWSVSNGITGDANTNV